MSSRNALRTRTVSTASIPSPVGGLNAVNPYAQMPATDAIQMDNWVPGVNDCSVRLGYAGAVTDFSAPVETLMTYNSATTTKLFACAGTGIYDATPVFNSGLIQPYAVGSAVVSGLSNARWQYVNFGTVGGQFLICANGADAMRLYDGSKWMTYTDGTGLTISSITAVGTTATMTTTAAHNLVSDQLVTVAGCTPSAYNVTDATITVTGANTFTYTCGSAPGGPGTVLGTLTISYPKITGLTNGVTSIKDVQVYASRVWLIEKDSFRVWYLPLNSVAGAANSIDFSSLYILGGSLAGMVTWQVASSYGVNTYVGFVSTQGEVLLYQGSDPSNAATWSKVGQFRIGRPIGQRFYERAGDDTLLITSDGIIPMSKAAITDRKSQSDAISYKIIQLINTDMGAYGDLNGWQVMFYPFGNKLFVNVPKGAAIASTSNIQYVMNTITNKWCRYTDVAANCWALYRDKIFFGGAGKVYVAEYGNNDDGAAITAVCTPAYSYFASPGQQKLFTAVRPIVTTNGTFQPAIGLATDFSGSASTSSPVLSQAVVEAIWDTVLWDVTPWNTPTKVSRNWQWIGGVGFSATMTMASMTKDMAISWASTDFTYERGGIF